MFVLDCKYSEKKIFHLSLHEESNAYPEWKKITGQNTNVTIINVDGEDYISITDLARHKSDDPTAVIGNWMRNRNTIEFLDIWESLYNPNFKPLEFEGFRKEAGLNTFTLSPNISNF